MTEEELLAHLDLGRAPLGGLPHAEHVHAAFAYLERMPPDVALGRIRASLRAIAAAAGKPERYHETITWTYLLLVAERRARLGGRPSWEDFAAASPDLLSWSGGALLHRYYRPETLESDLARRVFVFPDLSSAALDR